MARSRLVLTSAWLVATSLLGVLGCSSSSEVKPSQEPATADSGSPVDAGTPDTEVDPVCATFASRLQEALDTERAAQKVKHAALGAYTKRCGTVAVASSANGETPATTDTLFRIGSISKTFLAATVLSMVKDGKLGLDDVITPWFPQFPNAAKVTVKMLLNHTSGIADYLYTDNYAAAVLDFSRTPSVDERIGWVKDLPFTNEPGAEWNYSNTNYLILSRIVDEVMAKPWASVLRASTIDKVNMPHTFVFGEEPVASAIAPGPEGHELEWIGGDGAIVTTPSDLLTWLRALYVDRTVLDAPTFALMNTTTPIGDSTSYGLGMMRVEANATKGMGEALGHNGAVLGYSADAWGYPDTGVAIVSFMAKLPAKPHLATFRAEKLVLELLKQ